MADLLITRKTIIVEEVTLLSVDDIVEAQREVMENPESVHWRPYGPHKYEWNMELLEDWLDFPAIGELG